MRSRLGDPRHRAWPGRELALVSCKVSENGALSSTSMCWRSSAADRQADLASSGSAYRRQQSLAGCSPAEVEALTACVFGAIPLQFPSGAARLVADPLLFEALSTNRLLTPGARTTVDHSRYRRLFYISPDRRSRPFAVLANWASALISAAWRKNPVYSRHDA